MEPGDISKAAQAAQEEAATEAGFYGYRVLTITFDDTGAFQFRCPQEGCNVTTAIGLLQRAILAIEHASRARADAAQPVQTTGTGGAGSAVS